MSAQKHDANRDFIGFAEYPSFAEILSSERLISVMYESVCKLVGRERMGKKWLSDLAEERRLRGG